MGFNVNSVPRLDWDFTAWLGPSDRGITPEPSQKVTDAYLDGLRGLADEVGGAANLGDDTAVVNAIVDRYGSLTEDEQLAKLAEFNSELTAITADLTQGSPSAQQLDALREAAPRVFSAYLGWLQGSLRPEA